MEVGGQLRPNSPGSEEEEETWPWTVLNHIPQVPTEDRMLREERVYLFQGNPTNAPKLLRLFADGSFFHERKVRPSDTDVLEMIGHSRGLVCFKNASMRQILVWDLQRQRVRTIVAEVDEGGESSYGFGHRNGVYMIVRLGRPALFYNRQYFEYHIHTFVEGQQGPWTRFEFRLDAHFNFRTGGTGIWVSENGMMYWKAEELDGGASIITYNLETQQLDTLVAPREDEFNNSDMALGHGFKGQLSASVYVPPAEHDDYSMLHIWVLQREDQSFYRWHKLVAFRSIVFNADDLFIPLVCYYGREDGAIHILLHRNREEIVCVIPAKKQVLPVDGAAFQAAPAGILAIPSGIAMEVADARKFKATQTSRY
uniref:uncharacterized protein LOC105352388 n=1 Tax=Fragaria vesca subsp. vesca TaxID=101020 RepID=UPI0005CA3F3C|nr:PREDICTED: uncharacterized protein LOC105352388 [Fragaria vesca subsp. vesca]XP_011467723.1 PREDICTED: uncharacterized protein LOC105352388 [Fragaria vesca subsp. vesca]